MDPVTDPKNVQGSIRANVKIVTGGQPVVGFYDKWATTYDEQLGQSDIYSGPSRCADAAAKHLNGALDALILDIGCGTGLLAEKLAEKGFTNMEGLDPSVGMTEKALEKKLYKKIHQCYLTYHVESLESDKYDMVAGSGVFAVGHIPPSAISEVVRCLKPGGLAVFTSGVNFLSDSPMRKEMTRFEEEGKWKLLEETGSYNGILDLNWEVLVFVKS